MSTLVSSLVTKSKDGAYNLTNVGYTVIIIGGILLFLIGNIIFNTEKRMSIKQIAVSGMAVALAFFTSNVKLIKMPMGGSVTLFSMLFICLIGYWYGTVAGITSAVAYGFLQLVIDPYIISFPQMMVDYIFAFGALGLSGVFRNSKYGIYKGYVLGAFGRFVFSFLSGWIFFGTYAKDYGFSHAYTYSFNYNISYIGTECFLTLVILFLPPVKKAMATVKKIVTE